MGLKVGQLPEDVVISDIQTSSRVISEIWIWSDHLAKDWWQDSLVRHPVAWHILAWIKQWNTMDLSSKMSGRYPLWWSLCFSWWEINEFDISCIQVCLHFQQTQKHNSTRKVPRSSKSPKSSRFPTEEESERSSILQEFLDDHALLVRYGQGLSVAHAELNTLVEHFGWVQRWGCHNMSQRQWGKKRRNQKHGRTNMNQLCWFLCLPALFSLHPFDSALLGRACVLHRVPFVLKTPATYAIQGSYDSAADIVSCLGRKKWSCHATTSFLDFAETSLV